MGRPGAARGLVDPAVERQVSRLIRCTRTTTSTSTRTRTRTRTTTRARRHLTSVPDGPSRQEQPSLLQRFEELGIALGGPVDPELLSVAEPQHDRLLHPQERAPGGCGVPLGLFHLAKIDAGLKGLRSHV